MVESRYRLDSRECRDTLIARLAEPAPGTIQLVEGPRQVGKTTLLVELAESFGERALYASADEPEAASVGWWERTWHDAEIRAASTRDRPAVLFLDEIPRIHQWPVRLKGAWDRLKRKRIPLHVVATGSSSLKLGKGSSDSLAGRFERLTLAHWTASGLAGAFRLSRERAIDTLLARGTFPGAVSKLRDPKRWSAYIRDAIVEPALGKDVVDLGEVRKPALLRQLFMAAASSPAQIVSLQKLQGSLQDPGALETIASYLELLERAFLVAALEKFSMRAMRQRAAPPKLVTLNQAFLSIADGAEPPDSESDPAKFGAWLENAVLAHAWNRGQRVRYWREEPFDVDGILEGDWGSWAIEVKSGAYDRASLSSLLEFTRRHPQYRPLVLAPKARLSMAERLGVPCQDWREFLWSGPPSSV